MCRSIPTQLGPSSSVNTEHTTSVQAAQTLLYVLWALVLSLYLWSSVGNSVWCWGASWRDCNTVSEESYISPKYFDANIQSSTSLVPYLFPTQPNLKDQLFHYCRLFCDIWLLPSFSNIAGLYELTITSYSLQHSFIYTSEYVAITIHNNLPKPVWYV